MQQNTTPKKDSRKKIVAARFTSKEIRQLKKLQKKLNAKSPSDTIRKAIKLALDE